LFLFYFVFSSWLLSITAGQKWLTNRYFVNILDLLSCGLLLMNNSGPPGIGKTLTAETLAETFKAPLYTVYIKLWPFAADPTILSQIHLPLRYNPRKQEARKAVWRYLVKQAGTTAGPPIHNDEIITNLAGRKLNGRKISGKPTTASKI
jgi:hypothetical protein